jgi:magnesium chelatase family protein
MESRPQGWERLVVPLECADEASLVSDVAIIACESVQQVVAYIEALHHISPHHPPSHG